jgi:hypothetical protein
VKTKDQIDLAAARAEVQRVRDALLFAMFGEPLDDEERAIFLGRKMLRQLTQEQKDSLRIGMTKLLKPFERIMSFESGSPELFESIAELMRGAFLVGALTTRNAEKILQVNQAGLARQARARAPKEIALRAAIDAEYRPRTECRPTKEASAMLDSVNRRLAADGFDPVNVDVVRRRLEKLPRS